jgi:hypothetical protein
MARFTPSFPNDPGYQDPGDGQPLYPTAADYPTRRRFGASPSSHFKPVVGTTKGTKPRKPKPPRTSKRAYAGQTNSQPRQAGHSATRTHTPALARGHAKPAPRSIDEQLLNVYNDLYWAVLIPKALGAGYGYANGHITRPGHHPQATGRIRSAADLAHHGLARRAVILAYNSGTGTATVRDADAPDSPPYTVRVSPAVTGAIASASEAGLTLWDTGDPNDLLISTVI